jgi:4-amino-4-deoxy-L-arabinose transferase-like glycosyltransferase
MIKRDSYSAHNWPQRTIIFIAALSALRLGLMIVSPLNLHGDEAQYWAWAQDLDWGYFTKPPMIAWVIAATTALFGDAEWAVRLSSPILHALTAYMIFRTARLIYTAQTGFWAAVIYMLMPAVWLSSGIVSTDVPLLLAWIIALSGWLHLRRAYSSA